LLQTAAQHGFPEVCSALAAAGANLEAALPDGRTALILVAQNPDSAPVEEWDPKVLAITEVLLAKGANVNAKDEIGFTALTWAERGSLPRTAAARRAAGGVDPVPLMSAAEKRDLAAVQALIAGGDDVNFANSHGSTALLVGAENGFAAIVAALAKAGANVEAQDNDGDGAMGMEKANGHEAVKQALRAAVLAGLTAIRAALKAAGASYGYVAGDLNRRGRATGTRYRRCWAPG